MSGEMNLDNPVTGNRIDEFQRIEIMVEGGNKDVVHIEQEPAIGPLAQFPDKRPFIHFGLGESHITRHVFDCYPASEKILDPPDSIGDMVECFGGVRDRQEVVKIDPMYPSPAEMVGDPFRLETLGKSLERREVVSVERSGRCD